MRAVLAALLFLWALLTHAAITVVDDRGVAVSLPASPQRIVSLLPSLTETVCELGACSKIVGTDRYSNFPVSVQALPKTGGLDDANVEMIVALKPDLVLLAVSSRVTDRLESLGIRVMALEPKTHEDVRRVAGKVAQALGLPKEGDALWRRMERQMQDAVALVPTSAKGMSVYYEVDSAPYAAGEASFIGYNLHVLGVNNIVPSRLGPFPKLNPEYVVRADPQVIMLSAKSAPGLSGRPGWDRVRAIRDKRICAFTPEQGDVLSRPGPRMGEAVRILAMCLRDVAGAGGAR